ncbi:MAG: ACP S-malonyltransferase [Peptostreptococcus sp.]|uniref:ACP S-malonyltransferase n=1 Tax=Peptostreptococcus sp. TaxID=1262 RepID=UPI002FCABD36
MSRKIAILFPGQGSQYGGMGKEIIEKKSCENIYKIFEKIVDKNTFDIVMKASSKDLSHTRYAQLAIFLNSLSLYSILKEDILDKNDIEVTSMAGLSLGEYSALCASGIFDIESAVELLYNRGVIMEKGAANKGSMIAISRSDEETVSSLIEQAKENEILSICNLNSPSQIVVGGQYSALDRLESLCKENKIKRTVRLDVEGPFHTDILKESSNQFEKYLKKISYRNTDINVFSNLDGEVYTSETNIVDKLKKQMYSTVLFERCVLNMIERGCNSFIEVGPGKTLTGFVKKIDKTVQVLNIEKLSDIKKINDEV